MSRPLAGLGERGRSEALVFGALLVHTYRCRSTRPVESEKSLGVRRWTLKDCTATLSEEEQQAAVEKNYPMFSKPMRHDEFLSGLKSGKAIETKSRGYEAA